MRVLVGKTCTRTCLSQIYVSTYGFYAQSKLWIFVQTQLRAEEAIEVQFSLVPGRTFSTWLAYKALNNTDSLHIKHS